MIGKGKVDSILKYQAIGFDMDHTFIRYKLRHFMKHVYQAVAIVLINKHKYPQEVMPIDQEEENRVFGMNFRCIYDHSNGNLLKIGSNHLIMRAFHGFRRLSNPEVVEAYGKNPHLQSYKNLVEQNEDYTNLHEFYRISISSLIAHIVHLKDSVQLEALRDKSYKDIIADINRSFEENFAWPAKAF